MCGVWLSPGAVMGLTALVIYIGCMFVLWYLERTWCGQCLMHSYKSSIMSSGVLGTYLVQEGVALVKFQTFPISMELWDVNVLLRDMYASTRDKVKKCNQVHTSLSSYQAPVFSGYKNA